MPHPDPASPAGAGGPGQPGRDAGSGGAGSPQPAPGSRPPRSRAAASLGPTAEALAAAAEALEAGEGARPPLFDPDGPEPAAPAGDPFSAGPYAEARGPDPWRTTAPPAQGNGDAPQLPGQGRRGARRPPQRRRGKPRKKLAIGLIAFALVLILAGIGVAGYPFYTDIVAGRKQAALRHQLDQIKQETGADRLRALQAYADRNFGTGSPITYIEIPALGVKEVVVQGVTDQALSVGAGHYPQTPLPGQVGNVAIAGHRTMNGHPFGDLNKLVPGDKVILQTPFESYTYTVLPPFDGHNNPWIVQPTDWTVISFPTQEKLLTLTTCNPPGQQTNRLVARAVLST